ncbi:DUF2634 domain-containing protein [Aneurinibacillus thermoaerophilus]|uniref:Uncharacterized protein n=1 Tax=Aneurinibacillus thermoaerophilus TaxID=143495 RepID=A0A1G8ESP6_ANETH|nr:DUF2634 domain-containing protein [Aneurinibacillus thermoaerophilus]MED0757419.1 DUF2634 domain-containing protein [Aneurinibacillus thermoaerophilus]MED0762611.1 DUF2634 domain-containing protein [Aneurinibacillus thermoaerophilus]SDH72886.1 Protein of unknown function [Aneurinibacillus thermoaerophilus]
MADDTVPLFPQMDFSDLEEVELYEDIPSEQKWTYVMDFKARQFLKEEDGRYRRTKTYAEYLVQTAMRILNTERFQYAVNGDDIGVEKSEWPAWEDIEIKRDIEEALEVHSEIDRAEVLSMERSKNELHVRIRLVGLAGTVEMDEVIDV